ncbi:MAG: DUF4404 family protein [Methylococcaceae bacterium]|nr:DUF4404 family protein [Methylococcaceae bacterium]
MTEQKISAALEELRREIENLEVGDPEAKEKLNSLVENIEENLDYSGASQEHQHLLAEMKETVTQFEVAHPRITGILNEILMSLSNAGI